MTLITLISVGVGLALAIVYHLLSLGVQTWAARRGTAIVPLVTVLGFLGRLAMIVAFLVILGLWTPLNIVAVCLAFIALFTILTGVSIYMLLAKRQKLRSSTGAGEAR